MDKDKHHEKLLVDLVSGLTEKCIDLQDQLKEKDRRIAELESRLKSLKHEFATALFD